MNLNPPPCCSMLYCISNFILMNMPNIDMFNSVVTVTAVFSGVSTTAAEEQVKVGLVT